MTASATPENYTTLTDVTLRCWLRQTSDGRLANPQPVPSTVVVSTLPPWPERSCRQRVSGYLRFPGGSWWNLSMRAPFSGLTVLVVEDEWFVREDIANGFRQEGWMVLEAATGAKALELLRAAKSIDLVITDIGLADAMTGWDVAEAVRIMYPEVPVIYASGAPDNDGRRVSESVFMSKPLTAHDLMLACSRLLSTGR